MSSGMASGDRPMLARQASGPYTPQRTISSSYSSPISSIRGDDEYIVIELGARHLRIGFGGRELPENVMSFGPEEQRRVGDYRTWMAPPEEFQKKRKRGESWGEHHELWRMDVRDLDIGLVEDKIERAMRETTTKYLLLDSKPKRVVLALPPGLPHPLLETILRTIFQGLQPLTITLFSQPTLSTLSAGLRSALVVDIGWSETSVTGVFEYREIQCHRSNRAGKLLGEEMAKLLTKEIAKSNNIPGGDQNSEDLENISFEECEDVVTRLAWCQKSAVGETDVAENLISIPLRSSIPPLTLKLPFSSLSTPVETALFAGGKPIKDLDDDETPVNYLVYLTLRSLPIDARAVCMSRIIITGGCSKIPGLKRRIIDDVAKHVTYHGWDPVRGKVANGRRQHLAERHRNEQPEKPSTFEVEIEHIDDSQTAPTASTGPAFVEPDPDPVVDKLRRDDEKGLKPSIFGEVRGVESLGAWAGASLAAALKIKGVVEIEKDRFLQRGLAGASRESTVSVVPQRQSVGPGGVRAGTAGGDRSSWTLGAWA